MRIYTITLNPAYDVHAYTEHFAPFHENLAAVTSREAGGKGDIMVLEDQCLAHKGVFV